MSQNYSLFPHLSVRENILFGVKGKNPLFTLEEMLGWLRLTGLENRRVQQISGGQQQRVALARALMTGPSLLLLDEPFSALDALVRNKLRGDLLRIHRRFRLPIIFVTHNLEDALAVGDYIIVLHEGKILQGGEKNLVFARPNSVQTAKLVGMKNILPARVLQVDEAGRKILVDWDGKSLEGPWLPELEPGQRVVFGVRGEHILLIRPGRELKEQLKPNLFSARIEDVVRDWMGYRLILTFDHTRRKMEMLLPSHVYERYVDGKSTITVSFKPHSLCLLAVGSQNGGGTAPGSASTFFQGEHRIKHG
ncbi:MAG: ABC transporter ATP-binding protein [Clostridia bacterium]|nr:ABC transporter ATP-binding protein [Clostridia bacterium]